MTEARDKRRERALEESTSLLKNADPKRQLTAPVRQILEVVGRFADELCEGVEFHGLTKAWPFAASLGRPRRRWRPFSE
jgi:hypothetical protein